MDEGNEPEKERRKGPVPNQEEKLPGIKQIVAIASGKGGVGKSTVAVNLALALAQDGARVGLVDADVLGPSIPAMLGATYGEQPEVSEGKIVPFEHYGIQMMSMGMLTPHDTPAILRGPMVTKYIQAFISDVAWKPLDYLVLDLPPGTGDVQLTLAQQVPLSGAIIVTTPQDVSLNIARRGLRMFEKVSVPIVGLIENMSGFACPHCGEITNIFGAGGGAHMAEELGTTLLGCVPLDAEVVTGCDRGTPIVAEKPKAPAAKAFREIAANVRRELANADLVSLGRFNWDWSSGENAPPWDKSAVRTTGNARVPVGLRRRDSRTLSILWQDGATLDYDVRDLRISCPCAMCIDEVTGALKLDPKTVRPDVAPKTISNVGRYALGIVWNDGHSTGIYTFAQLRKQGETTRNVGVNV
jgi:ATP-binding protein involved in chromosome partitioning